MKKYKDFGVIAAHPKSWPRLEMGFSGDKTLHAGTPALLPGVFSEKSQDKKSAAIITADKKWTKKK